MPLINAIIDSFGFRIALVAIVFSSFFIYKGLNTRTTSGRVLMTKFDHAIPFLPVFVIPYILYLPFLFGLVSYGILATPHFAEIAASVLALQLAAALVYHLYETHVPRPTLTGNDVFTRLTAFIYRNDNPFCAFPSLHVAYAILCGYWMMVLFPAFALLIVMFSLAIIASTMLIKQHALVDVLGGACMGMLCVAVLH
jgi:membrane-associated phospholipid phosphatase